MQKTIGMFLGAAIGITLCLLLTLHLWGNSFYQIAASVFIGIIVGLFIANPKSAWDIISSGLLSALIFTVEIGELLNWRRKSFRLRQLKKFIPSRIFWMNSFIFLLLLVPAALILYFSFHPLVEKIRGNEEGGIIMIISFFLLLVYVVLVVLCIMPSSWYDLTKDKDSIMGKTMEKIWSEDYKKHKESFKAESISDLMKSFQLGFWSVSIRCGASSLLIFASVWAWLIFFFYSFAVYIISKLLGVALSPLFILKKIANYNWSLLVALSIAVGGLLGTFTSSFAVGLSVGLIFLAVLLLLKAILPENYLRFFVTYKNGLAAIMTGNVWE